MPPANELGSRQAAPRKSSAHLVRGPAACRDCPAGRKQCQPWSCSNDRLVKKHSGLEASLRLEHYLRRQALTTWAASSGSARGSSRACVGDRVLAITDFCPVPSAGIPSSSERLFRRDAETST